MPKRRREKHKLPRASGRRARPSGNRPMTPDEKRHAAAVKAALTGPRTLAIPTPEKRLCGTCGHARADHGPDADHEHVDSRIYARPRWCLRCRSVTKFEPIDTRGADFKPGMELAVGILWRCKTCDLRARRHNGSDEDANCFPPSVEDELIRKANEADAAEETGLEQPPPDGVGFRGRDIRIESPSFPDDEPGPDDDELVVTFLKP